ncbi:MAG: YSIRK-type signal peptide-containing protein, partial [Lactobacillus sp.]|nr:YSIRK-type signal peptide-containing protein [Lactobacillus sp.]
MLSKNNGQEQIRKQESKKQRFAIKKLTVGVASVLVGFTFMGLNASASADDTPTQPAKNDDNNVSSDTTNELQQSNVSLTTTEATDTAVKNNVSQTTDNSVDKASNVEANSASQKYEQSIAEKMELYKTSLVAVNNPNGDSQETNAPQQTTTLTSAPLYTTQGQVPALDMNSMFTQDQLSQYGDNLEMTWVTKPDVTNIGNVTGTAKLTYEDMNADPTEDGTIPTKTATVNVPVLVRKAEQEVKENQVKNSLDVINSSNNSLVAHYEWVGDKAANDEDEGISIPGRDAFESNFMTIIEKLGFGLDDYSEFPEDLMTFGTTNKSATLFVHPISNKPVIAEDPYFNNADGNSSIDNVNETPDPANYIGNLGTLPEGTKIEWNVAPTYDYTKDEDGNYTNPEPMTSPSIKVTIPGKDPIILDSDQYGTPLKEIATLPAYGDSTLLINPNNTLNLGDSVEKPTDYVPNLDSFIKKYLADNGEGVNPDNIQDFKDSFKWTIKPNTQQAGYTFGVFKYNDNVGNLVLFKVNPTNVDNSKTITRTIAFKGLPQDLIPKVDPQTVTFTQKGQQTYVDEPIEWTSDGSAKFDAVTAPEVAGYTVTNPDAAPEKAVTAKTEDSTVTFTYTANDQSATIKYVNNADHNDVVGTQPVKGKTGETVNVTYTAPKNWKIVAGQPAGETITFGSTPVEDTIVYVEHGTKDVTDDPTQANKVKKTITRTIDLDIAGKTSEYTKQTVTIHRTATEDLVTGKVTYGAWNVDGAKFDAVTAPEEAGYTVTNPNAASEVAVTGDTQDSTVTFTYSANDQSTTIKYVNSADHNDVVGTQPVKGKTGETVNVTYKAPENWKIVAGQPAGETITFGSTPVEDTIVYVEHGTEDVTDTDAKAKSTVTETINVTTPDGKTTPIVKSVTFNRTATKNLVTGKVSYGAWSDNGTYTFPSYTVPTVAGYTPSQNEVPAQTVKPGDKDLVFDITYSTNDQTRKIVFVDNGNTVGTQTLTGKTGTSVTIGNGNGETPLQVPTGYEVVPGTEIPTTVGFNANNNSDIPVQVRQKVDTDDGRNDKGNKDVYREVTRTITVNIEGQAPQTVTQTLAFYRIKTTNEATGKVTYTDWTSNMEDGATSFPELEIPSEAGYTRTITGGTITTKDGKDYVASQSGLENGEPVNNITVTVDYEKADHTQLINYVDKAGKVISHYNVNGKTGESVNTDIANHVPEGWVISGKYPTSITFGS